MRNFKLSIIFRTKSFKINLKNKIVAHNKSSQKSKATFKISEEIFKDLICSLHANTS